ncbi:unnamed protein product [Polarella glacialis]|uniref:FAD-dependent oxidoreductase 2 FAD-binding domain-containing protein n=1 Tax=Polarella glacialis TaxID=89957 RepID=A0A813K8G2_POLGL|nr:unnamed protein product [Polarella glacialis]
MDLPTPGLQQSARSLIVLKAFSGGGGMATWSLLGYAGPEPPERVAAARQAAGRTEHIFQIINSSITADTSLDFDAVVIGSGCGGAVAAAELACADHRVLVLEKGRYFSLSEMSGVEGEALDQLYERGGIVSTEDTWPGSPGRWDLWRRLSCELGWLPEAS